MKTAFLNSRLKEKIWVKAPEGCGDEFWLLEGAVYGLKQAAFEWRETVDKVMKEVGNKACEADPAAYYQISPGFYLALAVHVDDFILAHTDNEKMP